MRNKRRIREYPRKTIESIINLEMIKKYWLFMNEFNTLICPLFSLNELNELVDNRSL